MDNEKITLGVFFGGRSCEHDVSIITGLQLIKAVNKEKYTVIPVYIDQKGIWYTGEGLLDIDIYTHFSDEVSGIIPISLDLTPGSGALITYEKGKGLFKGTQQRIVDRIQCAVFAFHGAHGEDGCMQGLMEIANIPYTSGSVAASSMTMDKILMKDFLKGAGFPVVPGIWFYRSSWEKDPDNVISEVERFQFPVVIKPASLGSSIGVSLVKTAEELVEALEIAFSFDRKVLIEKAIEHKIELNCSVLGYEDDIQTSVLEKPKTTDLLTFKEKYLEGSKNADEGMASLARTIPASVSEELTGKVKKLSREIFHLLDLKGVVRIDYMVDLSDDQLYVTEVNTIPGSMAFYLWEHDAVHYADLIDQMVQCALKAFNQKNASSFAFESSILQGAQLNTGKLGTKGTKL